MEIEKVKKQSSLKLSNGESAGIREGRMRYIGFKSQVEMRG